MLGAGPEYRSVSGVVTVAGTAVAAASASGMDAGAVWSGRWSRYRSGRGGRGTGCWCIRSDSAPYSYSLPYCTCLIPLTAV